MLRAVLFDKDGTLVDLLATWVPAYEAAAARLEDAAGEPGLGARLLARGGFLAETRTLVPGSLLSCGSNDDIVALWVADPALADVPEARRWILETFRHQSIHHAVPVVPLGPLLDRLRGEGMALGVATMDNAANAEACLANLGVADRFDFVCGFDSGFGAKPDPGMVHAFCRAVGVEPAQTVCVGDAVRDLQMAAAAGAGLRVGVTTGATDADALAPHADHVLASIAGLPDLLA